MARIIVKIGGGPGSKGDEVPLSFTLGGRTFLVRAVLDRWHGADHEYYKLVASDGNLYVIRHDLEEGEWEMVMMEAIAGRQTV